MSSLQELIKKIHVTPIKEESYIYYDKDNGKIHKISGKKVPDDNYSIFPVASSEVSEILSGEKRTDEFVIYYDLSIKEIRLKEVAYDDNHKTASTMCFQLPVIKDLHDGHLSLEKVYEGTPIYIWDIENSYSKDQCVWYNNSVYKLKTDTVPNQEFDLTAHRIFVENVALTNIPTQTHTTEKLVKTPEYTGIHVDVWYKELSHLAGQHVWLNGNVYKLLEDQAIGTEFTMDNAEIIIENVKLYADENKSLKTINVATAGDIILDNNSIYSINFLQQDFDKDKTSIFFYKDPTTLLYYNDKNCLEVDLNTVEEEVEVKDIELDLTDPTDLKNGQIILSGKELFQMQVDKEYDIIVQQNTVSKSWNVIINPYTKKFLLTSGYNSQETLYFSVTAKYDPNILYRSLEFKVSDLLNEHRSVIPFIYDVECDDKDVSIYTAKYFDSYAHEII